jgi:hypothetical protein
MLQPIIRRPPRRTEGRFAGATSISPSSSRTSLVESMRSNCPLLGSVAASTFGVGTTWILHGCSETRPIPPENHSKSFTTNNFQINHSHLMAAAPDDLRVKTFLPDHLTEFLFSSGNNSKPGPKGPSRETLAAAVLDSLSNSQPPPESISTPILSDVFSSNISIQKLVRTDLPNAQGRLSINSR